MSQKRPAEQPAENNDVVAPEQDIKPLKRHAARRTKMKAKKSARTKLAIVGICLLFAAAIGLFGYQYYLNVGTGIVADKAQGQALDAYKHKLAESKPTSTDSSSVDTTESKPINTPAKPVYSMDNLPVWNTVEPGQDAYGVVHVPRFGAEWEKPLVQGFGAIQTSEQERQSNNAENQKLVDLLGVVHFGATQQVGEKGNFAVTGHRMGYGNAFEHAGELFLGDEVRISTPQGTYVYKVIQEAVKLAPTDTTFTDSNPLGDEKNTTRSLMTIITCEPANAWSDLSSGRMAVILELSDFVTP